MPNYEFQCDTCESVTVENYLMAERPEHIECACGGRANRIISMPNLVVKEAFLDGTKRKGFSELKEANKLARQRDNVQDAGERRKMADEIRRLGGGSLRKEGT